MSARTARAVDKPTIKSEREDLPRLVRQRSWKSPESRHRLHELLGALGMGVIDVPRFWRYMVEVGLDDADIERFCAEEAGWSPDPEDGGGAS